MRQLLATLLLCLGAASCAAVDNVGHSIWGQGESGRGILLLVIIGCIFIFIAGLLAWNDPLRGKPRPPLPDIQPPRLRTGLSPKYRPGPKYRSGPKPASRPTKRANHGSTRYSSPTRAGKSRR